MQTASMYEYTLVHLAPVLVHARASLRGTYSSSQDSLPLSSLSLGLRGPLSLLVRVGKRPPRRPQETTRDWSAAAKAESYVNLPGGVSTRKTWSATPGPLGENVLFQPRRSTPCRHTTRHCQKKNVAGLVSFLSKTVSPPSVRLDMTWPPVPGNLNETGHFVNLEP